MSKIWVMVEQGSVTLPTSDCHDIDYTSRSPGQPSYVIWVACENCSSISNGCRHHNCVNHICCIGHAEQSPCFVRVGFAKRNDCAPSQESAELCLPW